MRATPSKPPGSESSPGYLSEDRRRRRPGDGARPGREPACAGAAPGLGFEAASRRAGSAEDLRGDRTSATIAQSVLRERPRLARHIDRALTWLWPPVPVGAMLHVLNHPHPSRRRLFTAILVCAAIVPLALLDGQESSAQTQLETVRAQQDRIRAELADENAAVDAALARAGELRTRELEVEAELSEKEEELASARELLSQQRAALAKTKLRLRAASGDLKRLLVFIYKNGEIDEVQVLLDANGMDDLASRANLLGRINDLRDQRRRARRAPPHGHCREGRLNRGLRRQDRRRSRRHCSSPRATGVRARRGRTTRGGAAIPSR